MGASVEMDSSSRCHMSPFWRSFIYWLLTLTSLCLVLASYSAGSSLSWTTVSSNDQHIFLLTPLYFYPCNTGGDCSKHEVPSFDACKATRRSVAGILITLTVLQLLTVLLRAIMMCTTTVRKSLKFLMIAVPIAVIIGVGYVLSSWRAHCMDFGLVDSTENSVGAGWIILIPVIVVEVIKNYGACDAWKGLSD